MPTSSQDPLKKANQVRFSVIIALLAFLVIGFVGFQKVRQWRIDTDLPAATKQPRPGKSALSAFTSGPDDGTSASKSINSSTPKRSGPIETNVTTSEPGSDVAEEGTNEVSPEINVPVPVPGGAVSALSDEDEMELVRRIHKKILATTREKSPADMKRYKEGVAAKADFEMIPIKAGEFMMGSVEAQPNSKPDETPQHRVQLEAFWMQACEVTWNTYELFMYRDPKPAPRAADPTSDAVAIPSKPYVEMSFGMGKADFPAISMTQHAANKYCQWLSAKTGHFYRLPTEAEWEYACRAGTQTDYSFGDDPGELSKYAWFAENSDFKYQKVGTKLPNAWGLHDMHGNVAEWCLDQYAPYDTAHVRNPWNKATKPYPHVLRGGGWEQEASECRSASRMKSDPSWKQQDPQDPKSIWFLTEGMYVGFRVVRPLKIPSATEMYHYWNSGVEYDDERLRPRAEIESKQYNVQLVRGTNHDLNEADTPVGDEQAKKLGSIYKWRHFVLERSTNVSADNAIDLTPNTSISINRLPTGKTEIALWNQGRLVVKKVYQISSTESVVIGEYPRTAENESWIVVVKGEG